MMISNAASASPRPSFAPRGELRQHRLQVGHARPPPRLRRASVPTRRSANARRRVMPRCPPRAVSPRRGRGNWPAWRGRARWRCFPGGTAHRGSAGCVAEAHDWPSSSRVTARCDEAFRNVLDDQRVIARGGEGWAGRRTARAVMGDRRACRASARRARPCRRNCPIDWWPRHTPSKGFRPAAPDQFEADAGLVRRAGAGRDQEPLRARADRVRADIASLRTTSTSAPSSIR